MCSSRRLIIGLSQPHTYVFYTTLQHFNSVFFLVVFFMAANRWHRPWQDRAAKVWNRSELLFRAFFYIYVLKSFVRSLNGKTFQLYIGLTIAWRIHGGLHRHLTGIITFLLFFFSSYFLGFSFFYFYWLNWEPEFISRARPGQYFSRRIIIV